MLKTRIITAVVGVPLLLGIIYLGGVYWQGLMVLLTVAAMLEYFGMMRHKGFKPVILPTLGIALILLYRAQLEPYLAGLFFAGLLLMILTMVFRYPRIDYSDIALNLFAAFYIGFFFSYGLAVNEIGESFYILLLVFLLTWASDVGGYLFGRLWGKNKLIPQLSPGKTREGAIGAVLLTVICALLYKFIFKADYMGIVDAMLLGLAASLAAQLGDLLESAMKRYFGVKDSGQIIPGHGGVLDRFDSLLLVLPTVYYFLVVWM